MRTRSLGDGCSSRVSVCVCTGDRFTGLALCVRTRLPTSPFRRAQTLWPPCALGVRACMHACREQLEAGATHDELWNASQLEMVHVGKMHGFMRMYWCKKILEWTNGPEEAIEVSGQLAVCVCGGGAFIRRGLASSRAPYALRKWLNGSRLPLLP